MIRVRIADDAINPAEELAQFGEAAKGSGAIVSFTGQVRGTAGERKVDKLFLQSHPAMTERSIQDYAEKASERFDISALSILHRTGDILPNETIVFVAAAANHRRAAFEAADFMMDYLKTRAIFWKKEIYEGGSEWIEPRTQDYADTTRWEQ